MIMNTKLKPLTAKEEEVLEFFWQHGSLFVREIVELYPEPRPHFNTVSTVVRTLEEKGYVSHIPCGKSFRYQAIVTPEDMGSMTLSSVLGKFFKNSGLRLVNRLVQEDKLTADELRDLLRQIERGEQP